jgi:hypothetical protein
MKKKENWECMNGHHFDEPKIHVKNMTMLETCPICGCTSIERNPFYREYKPKVVKPIPKARRKIKEKYQTYGYKEKKEKVIIRKRKNQPPKVAGVKDMGKIKKRPIVPINPEFLDKD